MSKILTNNQYYHQIADVIREQNGTSNTYKPAQMVSALKDLFYEEVEGVPPITFQGIGENLLDYKIDGAVGGVGDRTENLFDYSTVTTGYRITWATGISVADNSAIMSDFIAVSNGIYRTSVSVNLIGYDINKNYIGTYDPINKIFKKDYGSKTTYYDIADNNVKFVKLLSFSATDTISQDTMFCIGTTIPEYEPYGYKVPVVINGKNLLNTKLSTTQLGAGITFQKNNDGTVVLNGTPSSNFSLLAFPVYLTAARYVLSGCPENQDSTKLRCDLRDSQYATVGGFDIGNGVIISVNSPGNYFFGIRVGAGYNCNNLKFYPMIRLTTIEDDTYEPYIEPTTTNIYLDEPIGANESISLSDTNTNIPTIRGTNVLTVDTTVQSSNVYVKSRKESQYETIMRERYEEAQAQLDALESGGE